MVFRAELHSEIEIDATPERVWEELTDLPGHAEWDPFLVEASGEVRYRINERFGAVGFFDAGLVTEEPSLSGESTFKTGAGLGVRIVRAQKFLNIDQIFVAIAVIGLLGIAADLTLRTLRDRLAPWSQE